MRLRLVLSIVVRLLARLVGLAAAVVVGLPILVGLRRHALLRLLGRALLAGRREAVGQAIEIVVAVIVLIRFSRRPLVAVGRLLLSLLRGGDQPKIMLGVLQVALGHDRIAGRLRIASEL